MTPSPKGPPLHEAGHDELAAWDYPLPEEQVARRPAAVRSRSRLLYLPRAGGEPLDHTFADLPGLLRPGDLLVGNDTRVMPARLRARRATGGAVEVLLLEPGPGPVRALVRPLRRLAPGEELALKSGASLRLLERLDDGQALVELDRDPLEVMEAEGEMPLPPYLGREAVPEDRERYQTVFARAPGSAAAPTAGLHFDAELLGALEALGIGFARVTLHVGIGTFRPLRPEDLARGELHEERWEVSEEAAGRVAATRAAGGRVIAVGTTSVRTLESATPPGAHAPEPGAGATRLFVRPGYRFRSVDGLVTNFHLPRSSLLMLVAAMVGRERLLSAYATAIGRGYRFYSYGDAMLVL